MIVELLVVCMTIGAENLAQSTTTADDSAALQAAWEKVVATVPQAKPVAVDETNNLSDEPRPAVTIGDLRPDAGTLNWFLGFVDGRTRVTPPDWWREAVLAAGANGHGNIYFLGQLKSNPYQRLDSLWFPTNAAVEIAGNAVCYRVGEEKLAIPEELLLRADGGKLHGALSGCFTEKHLFVAVHGFFPDAHDVACLERESGRIVWKSKACGCIPPSIGGNGHSGRSSTWVSVVPTDNDRVFVSGAANAGYYLHGFRASDGKSLVEFSSN